MTIIAYPQDLNITVNDYVSFTHFEYRSNREISGSSVGFFGEDTTGTGEGIDPPAIGNTIHLYMPNSTPAMGTTQDWATQNFKGAFGKLQLDAIGATVNAGNDIYGAAMGSGDITTKINQISESLGLGVGQLIETSVENGPEALRQKVLEGISKEFLGNPNAALSIGQGKISNSNIEIIYNGPQTRGFSLSFLMIPKTPEEAMIITEIIREFKIWSAPELDGNYYKIPHVWRVEYKSPLTNNMNVFKRSVLTNVNVEQNPGQTAHMTFDDGYPISTAISLSFLEVDVITRKDQRTARGIGF